MNIRTRRVAVYGLLIALAFVFGYIERILPIYLGAPGVKLGLANLVTILSLYVLGLWPAVWISLARILLCLWGNVLHSVQPGWSGPKPACYVDLPPFFSF